MNSSSDEIHYQSIKEDRGPYFVEYHPLTPSTKLAILGLVFPKETDISIVVAAMEKEEIHFNYYNKPVRSWKGILHHGGC